MREMSRRNVLKFAAVAGLTGTAAACSGVGGGSGGGGSGGTDAGGSATLRYAWWGNNVRQENYTNALNQFMEDHSEITVETEFAEYTAFQERMTTQMAARNVPDLFWVPSAQVMTYYANDMFHDLDGLETLDLSDYDADDIDGLRLDGVHNTMALGIFVPVVRYNETMAQADGATLPEGADWTWDGFTEFAIDYAANNPNGNWAVNYGPDHDLTLEAWLRQRGEELWTGDGQIGFTADGIASWLDFWENLRKNGAAPSLSEQDGVGADWALIGERVLTYLGNSNHIIDDAQFFPEATFKLRTMPVAADATPGHPYLYTPRLAIFGGIDEANLEAAGTLLNFSVNNTDTLRITGLTMGAPVNPRVAAEVAEFASPDEQQMLDAVAHDRALERNPRFEAPAGSSTWRTILTRVSEQVALEQSTTIDAATAMIAELQSAIDRAS
ncbi:ABC transporter substrate-binding protein [Occultella aeris]|uniref:ABC transporter substrate-binding protein YesO n=2 Tax=Occultella aeris TaxID=2761496 RepID=A0A7M4DKK9_9MICO|nr:Putative ABC transporter substrate-binding protein YesO [Occultella aeris]